MAHFEFLTGVSYVRSTFAERAKMLADLQEQLNFIEDLNIIGVAGEITTGAALRVLSEQHGRKLAFEAIYDHGNGD